MADRPLKKLEPFKELMDLRENMDRLFNSFFGRSGEELEGFWSPIIDIEEDNGSFSVQAEIPGMKKEDIKISVRGNLLSIYGERQQESTTKNKTFHRIERSYGKFSRIITLPADVDPEKVKAVYKDGILTITLPKLDVTKHKEIDVEIR